MHGLLTLAAVLAAASGAATLAAGPAYSELWGRAGEKWDPAGRLPDFSHAGYMRGEAPLPEAPVVASVRDFGAVGDGETDDTEAFKRAIEQAEEGAILIPAGRYLITDILEIRRPNVVLRGEGPERTTLVFTRGLEDVRPNPSATTSGRPTSNYSWSGGFIWVRGDFQSRRLAEVTARARRGQREVAVSSTSDLAVGQEIEIRQRDGDEDTLALHLYADQPGDISNLNGRTSTSFNARIEGIEGGKLILDRRLRTDIDPKWNAQVLRYEPTVTNVGIERLRFEFPQRPYEGHFTERGYNAIALQNVSHCWVRDVVIDHSDSGIFVSGRNCTLEGIEFNSDRDPDRGGNQGHHGITLGGQDNLLTGFAINQRFIHDITVTSGSAGNVASRGRGVDLTLDHHKRAPHANLFSDIDAGEGTRLWRSGGGAGLGRHSAAWATFWNVRTARPQEWPGGFGPDLMNLVGLRSESEAVREKSGRWLEPAAEGKVAPADLHRAQVERRQR